MDLSLKFLVFLFLIVAIPKISFSGTCNPTATHYGSITYYETDFNDTTSHDGYPVPSFITDKKCSDYTSAPACYNGSYFTGQISGPNTFYSYNAELSKCGNWICSDNDGDGYSAEGTCGPVDCNDSDPDIYPGASDICDNKDNDCDGFRDEDATFVDLYLDADGDNYGTASSHISSCSMVAGYVTTGGDCNDTHGEGGAIHPGAAEICTDHVDNDCNGLEDALDGACLYRPSVIPLPVVTGALSPTVCN